MVVFVQRDKRALLNSSARLLVSPLVLAKAYLDPIWVICWTEGVGCAHTHA